MSRERRDDDELARLMRELGDADRPDKPCPDADLLAAFVHRTLPVEPRDLVERHVAACGACREVVAGLVRAGVAPASPRRTLEPRAIYAAAAVAVLSLGTWLVLRGGEPDRDSELAELARQLAVEHADLFADFAPVSRDDRLAPSAVLQRGGPALVSPAERVLERRPAFRWHSTVPVEEWRIALRLADGEEQWSAVSPRTELVFPADRPDLEAGQSYLWSLSADGPFGEISGSRAFEIVDEASTESFREAMRVIATISRPEVGSLLQAHYAVQKGLLGEAEKLARTHCAEYPGDAVGKETLFCVLQRSGSPEAEDWRPEPTEPGGPR